jgi:serine/threonine protein kinase
VRLDEAEEHTIRELRKEAEMLEKLSNHPCIVKFVGAITQGTYPSCDHLLGQRIASSLTSVCAARGGATTFALVTEYCCRGSLHDLLVL